MAIILEKDSETGETLVYRTHSHRNSETGETETVKELLGGMYPFVSAEDMNGADYKDKTEFQKMAYNIGIYKQMMEKYERIEQLQQSIIDTQKKEMQRLKEQVTDLTARLAKYEGRK